MNRKSEPIGIGDFILKDLEEEDDDCDAGSIVHL